VLAATTTTTGSDQVAAENGLTLWEASKRFGSVQALDDCSFSVERGRMLGFLGPAAGDRFWGQVRDARAMFIRHRGNKKGHLLAFCEAL
jgi:hypothetical protein